MKRREFITLVGAATWPVVARAQQPAMPVIGMLSFGSAGQTTLIAAFREGLREAGYVEGTNVTIEYRWSEGRYDRLSAMAADLASRKVTVIAAVGGPGPAIAAKAATATIPIVFVGGSDPIAAGLVASINRPGGNVTGIVNVASVLTAKRLELLRDLVPRAMTIAALRNPSYPEAGSQVKEIEDAARQLGEQVYFVEASVESDFDAACASIAQQNAEALLVANDPYFASQRSKLTAIVARYAIPAIWAQREFAEAGGLMSYGTNFAELYRQGGVYTGSILKGQKPADLPVLAPTKYELVINLKTAKALGLTVPPALLTRADEVIE